VVELLRTVPATHIKAARWKRKKSIPFLLTFALVLTTVAQNQGRPASPPAQQSAPSEDENARHAHQIVDQMIAALGGDAYLNMQDYESEGRSYGFSHGESGIGFPVWRFWKWPDKERVELTKQRDVIQIYNGDSGWEITYKGTALLPREALDSYKLQTEHSLPQILRVWTKSPNVVYYYAGTAVAEQKETDHITVYNGQDSADLYVDMITHLPIRKTFEHRNEQYHDKDTEEEVWGNYRAVQGVNTPYDYTRKHNGDIVVERFITKITYNNHLPDSLFLPKNAPAMLPEKKK
jgi:hypothetical protein